MKSIFAAAGGARGKRGENRMNETQSGRRAGSVWRGLGRAGLVLGSALLALLLGLYSVMLVLTHGPSESARRIFVLSCNETSAMKWLPRLCLSGAAVDEILAAGVQTELNTTPPDPAASELGYEPGAEALPPGAEQPPAEQPELEVVDIKGSTYKGKLLLVKDPRRVIVGTLDHYGSGQGMFLTEFIEKYQAVAGTNAGGFEDIGGNGNGSVPDGLVIRDGVLAWGNPGLLYTDVVGFDDDHRLHVGNMTGQQALDLGLTSAVSFSPGPVLIVDGVVQEGLGGGMNPRTCIGQRADGTVLLAVIEGRHPSSFGATYDDLAALMADYGAVNAANLDGGSSSAMFYHGEQITRGSNIVGSRRMATAILVLPE